MASTRNAVLLLFDTTELYRRVLLEAVDPVPTEPCRALFVWRGINRRTRALIDGDAELQRLMWLKPSSATNTTACALWGCRFLADLGLAPPIDRFMTERWGEGGAEMAEVIELQATTVEIDYESTPVKFFCGFPQLPQDRFTVIAHKDALWRRILFNTGPVEGITSNHRRIPLQVTWRLELESDKANKSRLFRNSELGIATISQRFEGRTHKTLEFMCTFWRDICGRDCGWLICVENAQSAMREDEYKMELMRLVVSPNHQGDCTADLQLAFNTPAIRACEACAFVRHWAKVCGATPPCIVCRLGHQYAVYPDRSVGRVWSVLPRGTVLDADTYEAGDEAGDGYADYNRAPFEDMSGEDDVSDEGDVSGEDDD